MIDEVMCGVLVVDDDSSFRDLARRFLEQAGVLVAGEASSVCAARAAAQQLKPEAVLLDVGLPDGDGMTLAGELTMLPWRPRIVLTSCDASVGSDEAVERSGAAAFIPKDKLGDGAIRALVGIP
jgi:CheY-like chemotaxis protein